MIAAGYSEIEQSVIQVGYHLGQADEWWMVIWNTAMRALVERLPKDVIPEFKKAHLERVTELKTDNGLWMDVEVRLTSGRVN
jgi:hypothetical protein